MTEKKNNKLPPFTDSIPSWLKLILVVVVIFLVLLKCSDTPTLSSAELATQAQMNMVNAVIEDGLSVSPGYTIRSTTSRNAWYVTGAINGPGLENEIGVWLVTGSREQPGGGVFAASHFTGEFSKVPYMGKTKAGDPGDEARELVRYTQAQQINQ